ncbi:hypothetical protein EQO05_07300 [Methanosarcina sp. MSH10X1]|uniref:hypothetical protein n=1 Tax=Methanosarcina sp. MSH10X1 TaxID=2507075 RepID=UPI000FFB1807|nr:hypothetical protein [Methanosarcina sp. MSH10X1]RXA19943.1 hypothetical protein EQO05_07300 [Methanosarcina sp. MSH10X1]
MRIKIYELEKIKYILEIGGGNLAEIEKLSNPEEDPGYKNKHPGNFQEYFLVGISYVLLTVILAYPVIFKIKTNIPGTGEDSFQWMRILWYTKKQYRR